MFHVKQWITLSAFEELFRKWSKAINLASPSTLDQLWERHIVDSAQLFDMAPNARSGLILGSGGGFPGVVLAILLKQRSGSRIDLVESNGKKAAFLRTAIGQFSAPGTVHATRIDAVWAKIRDPDIITARALASLSELIYACGAMADRRCSSTFSKRTGLPQGNCGKP